MSLGSFLDLTNSWNILRERDQIFLARQKKDRNSRMETSGKLRLHEITQRVALFRSTENPHQLEFHIILMS